MHHSNGLGRCWFLQGIFWPDYFAPNAAFNIRDDTMGSTNFDLYAAAHKFVGVHVPDDDGQLTRHR